MKSEDMKMKKFEMLIRDIDEYLGRTGIVRDVYIENDENTSRNNTANNLIENSKVKTVFSPVELFIESKKQNEYHIENSEDKTVLSPIELFIESKKQNEYLKIILKNSFRDNLARYCREDGFYLSQYVERDVNAFIEKIRKCNNCNNMPNTHSEKCSVPRHLMFWLIFIVSVDNENYNENLSIVSDVAYMIGFDEKVLADWIVAVKGVLEGKKLNEMEYKTEEAKSFFIR